MRMYKTAKFKGDCWLWPYSATNHGYGQIQDGKKIRHAYRWLYELIKGKVPYNSDLDHLCRNKLCVNPEHLEPVSHAVNCRRGSNAKLTAEDVVKIRSLFGKQTQKSIAEEFGVSPQTINFIYTGRTWK